MPGHLDVQPCPFARPEQEPMRLELYGAAEVVVGPMQNLQAPHDPILVGSLRQARHRQSRRPLGGAGSADPLLIDCDEDCDTAQNLDCENEFSALL